jgi:hypothetical protein
MQDASLWTIDMGQESHAAWCAARIKEGRARVVAIEDTVTLGFFEELQEELNKRSCACLMPRLHGDMARMRMVKDSEELELLRKAQRITDEAFEHICGFIRPGQTELQIRAELEGFMLSHGAEGLSFDSIIASGPNGANPHARPSDRVVQKGDLVVMDYGALYGDYHADMTRTVCVGRPSDEQQRVYDVVRRAHEACAAAAKPGMGGKELHPENTHDIRTGSVIDLGGDSLEICQVPGHTPGSVVVLEKKHNKLFTGDAIGSGYGVWMQVIGATDLETYYDSLVHMMKWLVDRGGRMEFWGGHSYQQFQSTLIPNYNPLSMGLLADLIDLVDKVVEGEIVGRPSSADKIMSLEPGKYVSFGRAEMQYMPSNIRKA